MAQHRRADRVAEAIREEAARFLAEGVKDPRVTAMVTVTGVDVTGDLRYAKIFVSVLGSDEERTSTFEGLESVQGHLRSRIARAMRLRVAPEVRFVPDESIARAARIDTLLNQIRSAPAPQADNADHPTVSDEEKRATPAHRPTGDGAEES